MANKFKNYLINTFLIFFGFAMAFFVLELGLRLSGHQVEKQRNRMTYDNRLGHLVDGGDWYKNFKKNLGKGVFQFKGKEVFLNKDSSKKRILFLGDSGTYGSGVMAHLAFPERLEEKLHAKGHQNVEVVNAGVPGFTNVNAFHFYKFWLSRLRPEVVVLGIFMANDINFNLLNYKQSVERDFISNLSYFLRQHSALINFIYYRSLVLSSSINHEFVENKIRGSWLDPGLRTARGMQMIDYVEGELSLYLIEDDPMVMKSFEVTKNVLEDFKELSQVLNFEFRVVMIPTASSLLNKAVMLAEPDLDKRIAHFNIREEEFDFQKPTRKILGFCDELKITCLDTIPILRELGPNAFLQKDDHLSLEAHERVSSELEKKFSW